MTVDFTTAALAVAFPVLVMLVALLLGALERRLMPHAADPRAPRGGAAETQDPA